MMWGWQGPRGNHGDNGDNMGCRPRRPQPWGPHGDLLGAMGMMWRWWDDTGMMWGWQGQHGDHGDNEITKNSPIKGWGGLSKMSKKMSIIELSRIGQDLFDFSDLTWGHPLTHSPTHSYLQTKSNYINKFKLYYISHLTWPNPLTHPLIHTPIHSCGCLNKS